MGESWEFETGQVADTSVLVDINAEPQYAFSFDLEEPLKP